MKFVFLLRGQSQGTNPLKLKLEDITSINRQWMLAGQPVNNFLLSKGDSLNFFSRNYLSYIYEIVFLFIGFLRIISLFLSQKPQKGNDAFMHIDHLIGSTQFGYIEDLEYRHKNYFKIFNDDIESKHIILDEYDRKALTGVTQISFQDLFKELRVNAKESSTFFGQIRSVKFLSLILPNAVKNIALFSYLSLLFRYIKDSKDDLKFFSGGSELFASAAIKESVTTYLLKHGAMSQMSKHCFLKYAHVYVYSKDDLEHIKEISPETKVSIYASPIITKKTNNVIFFGAPRDLNELKILSELVHFFKAREIKPYYKSHPIMTIDQNKLISDGLDIEIIDEMIDASDLIKKLQPRFCIGWASTALCESLNAGVIPISTQLDREQQELKKHAILYPFSKRAVFWSKDKKVIISALNSQKEYDNAVQSLRES
jgi:hypothetical protein